MFVAISEILWFLPFIYKKTLSQVYHELPTEEPIIYERFILPQALF